MNTRPLPLLILLAIVALLVPTLGVTGAPFLDARSPTGVLDGAPAAGGAVCVTGAGPVSPDADVLLLAAPEHLEDPDGRLDAIDAGSARVLVRTLEGTDTDDDADRASEGVLRPVDAGTPTTVRLGLDAQGWAWVGWADRPVAAWQEWRTDGAPGTPRGRVVSRCIPTDPPTQSILGLRTDGGNEALIRLANPFSADATFAVTFVTPTEVIEPVALRNVSVPAGTRVTVRVNDHVPEQAAVAARVDVGAGRLAVEGLQRTLA